MGKISDEWRTPQWLFDELNKEFNFDIDLCATVENSKCSVFSEDYLNDNYWYHYVPWRNRPIKNMAIDAEYKSICCFMNPPYSNPKPFIEKAWKDSKHCKIVCLVKCDPSTRWWATFWDYDQCDCGKYICNRCNSVQKGKIGPKPGCEVRFFPKCIKFDPPKGQECCSCDGVHGTGFYTGSTRTCRSCKRPLLSGPRFPCALIIMDRRN